MSAGIRSMSAEQYFAADGLSRSMLEYLLPPYRPCHFHSRFIAKTVEDHETPAKRLGSLTHRTILEPETMDGAFHVKPEGMNFTTKEGRQWKVEHSDREIICADDAAAITGMRAAVWAHGTAARLLKGARTEAALFAQDSRGTLRKARVDAIPAGGNVLPDLKTCESADPREIGKTIIAYGYHRQAAYTLDLCRLLEMPFAAFVLICVEKTPPHDVCVYELDQDKIEFGQHENEQALRLYRECLASGKWPGQPTAIEQPLYPAWFEAACLNYQTHQA